VLELVVGIVAGLLFLTGLVIMAGPAMPRALGIARRRRRPTSPRRRTTLKALAATARLLDMLKEHGLDRHAAALRTAGKRLQVEEANGIYAMRQVLRHLRGVRFEDESDQKIFQGLITQLQRALDDRAEQLELLPKN
jgi:hypothetical protein